MKQKLHVFYIRTGSKNANLKIPLKVRKNQGEAEAEAVPQKLFLYNDAHAFKYNIGIN